jgi:hypothetical protein
MVVSSLRSDANPFATGRSPRRAVYLQPRLLLLLNSSTWSADGRIVGRRQPDAHRLRALRPAPRSCAFSYYRGPGPVLEPRTAGAATRPWCPGCERQTTRCKPRPAESLITLAWARSLL